MTEHRIVSLLPSTTEIACALGLRDNLLGRSHECDFPSGVEALPALTSAKILDGTSREIDDRVKHLVAQGLAIYAVDADLLKELAPTVILTQDHCEVCAASLGDVEAAVAAWVGGEPQIVSLSPTTLDGVWRDIERVAVATDRAERGRTVASACGTRVAALAEQSAGLAAPTVACIEWVEPLMSGGNWMPEVVAAAGGHNLFGEVGAHSPWLEWSDLRAADPDVVVVLPCGFDLARTRTESAALQRLDGWSELRAVREERVFVADGNAFFNRPGPRLVESVEIMAEILHPETFAFGHRGVAFESFA